MTERSFCDGRFPLCPSDFRQRRVVGAVSIQLTVRVRKMTLRGLVLRAFCFLAMEKSILRVNVAMGKRKLRVPRVEHLPWGQQL